ncbi:MAG TPA: prepilin peptidase [Candidatus Acidoferrum sp.]|nr:prepilin peptidase [Candidatus Acidoferrum sp.]
MPLPSSTIDLWLGTAFLAVAAYWNWRYLSVPNSLLALFLLSFFPVAWLSGMPFAEVMERCAVFGVTLLVVLLLFSLRVLGGGAGKLAAVTTLWLPLPIAAWFGVVLVVLAGALYLAMRHGGGGRWIEVLGENFASIVGALGIVLLAIAA